MPLTTGPRRVAVRNRERGQLLHALDARYLRVAVTDVDAVVRELCRVVDPASIDCVVGFPEGGTPFAYAGARILERPLVLSTRLPHALPGEIEFDEPHDLFARRPHYIYALEPGDRVVIVEDEITTGITLLNAIRALRDAGVRIDDVLTVLAPDDPDILAPIRAEGVRVTVHELVPVDVSRAVAGNPSP